MNDILKIHDRMLTFLLNWRKNNPDFTFALRRSDLGRKLSKGYWFYGTDETIAVSFWTGIDWSVRMPNISFCYNIKDQESYVQISVGDSIEKKEIVEKLFRNEFQFGTD